MAKKDQDKQDLTAPTDALEHEVPREGGSEQVDDAMHEAQEKGHFGDEVDPTPNEHYTLRGVVEHKPTPETDKDAAREARAHIERNRVR